MSSGPEALQKVFKTLSDPTRIRILRLLEQEELIVGELMDILGMAQSRVSRHLAILREAGLLTDRRDGTFVAYRLVLPDDGPWARRLGCSPADGLRRRPDSGAGRHAPAPGARRTASAREATRDAASSTRSAPSGTRFAPSSATTFCAPARRPTLVPPERLRVADIGTGTGVLALELAALGLDVVGIDQSGAHARRRAGASGVRARPADSPGSRGRSPTGDAHALPLEDASVDAAFAHMVLHSLESPGPRDRRDGAGRAPGRAASSSSTSCCTTTSLDGAGARARVARLLDRRAARPSGSRRGGTRSDSAHPTSTPPRRKPRPAGAASSLPRGGPSEDAG